jgi:CheY-like chemotaxis protein
MALEVLKEKFLSASDMESEERVGRRILLVDDEPSVRETVEFLLRLDGHAVTQATNGRQALEMFECQRYDLVITDYSMPEMRGDTLAVKIKEKAPTQPILMITAYPQKLGGVENPVNALLSKPFSISELRSEIKRLLTCAVQDSVASMLRSK